MKLRQIRDSLTPLGPLTYMWQWITLTLSPALHFVCKDYFLFPSVVFFFCFLYFWDQLTGIDRHHFFFQFFDLRWIWHWTNCVLNVFQSHLMLMRSHQSSELVHLTCLSPPYVYIVASINTDVFLLLDGLILISASLGFTRILRTMYMRRFSRSLQGRVNLKCVCLDLQWLITSTDTVCERFLQHFKTLFCIINVQGGADSSLTEQHADFVSTGPCLSVRKY